MQVHDVQVTKVEATAPNELADTFFRVCGFCDKLVRVAPSNFQSCTNLGGNKFYCPFCLRHSYHFRSSRNILIMSYRAIVGYYYLRMYNATPQKMWWSEIATYLDRHAKVGLQNPVFNYDPETMLWFVDFNRVGSDGSKAPFAEVVQMAREIYDVFNVDRRLTFYVANEMWTKFDKALKLFYEKRKRPKDRRMLIPTFVGSFAQEKDTFWDGVRDFVRADFVIK